jgi:hypothetical protein
MLTAGCSRTRAELAYGDARLNELITPGAVLVFELQLLKVMGSGGAQEL